MGSGAGLVGIATELIKSTDHPRVQVSGMWELT